MIGQETGLCLSNEGFTVGMERWCLGCDKTPSHQRSLWKVQKMYKYF